MGTPGFARVILESLWAAGYPIVGVVAQPDRPVGRGQKMTSPPVAEFARQKKITLLQPEKIRDTHVLDQIAALAPDYIVVAAYGKILPARFLQIAKKECLNVHASLLPRYRGAAPINHALLDDQRETGVSIMRVVQELDAGPVFFEKKLPITDDDNAEILTEKMAQAGAQALLEVLQRMEDKTVRPVPQNNSQATFTHKLSRELAPVSWQNPARKLFNQVRALVPWPVAETSVAGKRLRLYKTRCLAEQGSGQPGQILHISEQGLTVATGQGNLLVQEVQLEGKKRMRAFDLANGLRLKTGDKLG